MFSIVGSQIYIHQGDECAFKIVHRDSEDNLVNFESSDIITMTISDMNTQKVILKKISESIVLEEGEVSIFVFTLDDYRVLLPGDYIYNIMIDTGAGTQYTLVDRAYFSVIKSPSGIPEFETSRLQTFNDRSFYLSNVPMICKFNHTKIRRRDADGTLVLFNRLVPPTVSEDEDDNSLILFSESGDDEDTLIIF